MNRLGLTQQYLGMPSHQHWQMQQQLAMKGMRAKGPHGMSQSPMNGNMQHPNVPPGKFITSFYDS